MHLVGFGFQPSEKATNAVPVAGFPEFREFPGRPVLPFEDKLLLVGSKFLKGDFERDFVFAAGFFEVLLAFLKAGSLPGFDGATG